MYGVFQNMRTLKYYDVGWEIPATENQEIDMFYGDTVTFSEVKPVEKVHIVYEAV